MRPSWDNYFLGIAKAVSARASCTRRQVGAVVVKDNRIVSTGYNGAPAGFPDCLEGACPRGRLTYEEQPEHGSYDNCISVHAEANALLYGDRDKTAGATIYITDEPCPSCRKLIAGAGIKRMVWPGDWELVEWPRLDAI
jgi:deoxycytidylate deaminase